MKQRELERAVAAATGESIREIRQRGFSVITMPDQDDLESYDPPQVMDWDRWDQSRVFLSP